MHILLFFLMFQSRRLSFLIIEDAPETIVNSFSNRARHDSLLALCAKRLPMINKILKNANLAHRPLFVRSFVRSIDNCSLVIPAAYPPVSFTPKLRKLMTVNLNPGPTTASQH